MDAPGRTRRRPRRVGLLATMLAAAIAIPLVSAGGAAGATVSFRTPSNNVHCYSDSGPSVQCWVLSATCRGYGGATYAYSWAVRGNGRPSRFCPGDIVRGSRVLRYGQSLTFRGTRCVSRTSGLTCTRTATGRGFFLSRERQRIF